MRTRAEVEIDMDALQDELATIQEWEDTILPEDLICSGLTYSEGVHSLDVRNIDDERMVVILCHKLHPKTAKLMVLAPRMARLLLSLEEMVNVDVQDTITRIKKVIDDEM